MKSLDSRSLTRHEVFCDILIVALIVLTFTYFTPHIYLHGVHYYNTVVSEKNQIVLNVGFKECVDIKKNNLVILKDLINNEYRVLSNQEVHEINCTSLQVNK